MSIVPPKSAQVMLSQKVGAMKALLCATKDTEICSFLRFGFCCVSCNIQINNTRITCLWDVYSYIFCKKICLACFKDALLLLGTPK